MMNNAVLCLTVDKVHALRFIGQGATERRFTVLGFKGSCSIFYFVPRLTLLNVRKVVSLKLLNDYDARGFSRRLFKS